MAIRDLLEVFDVLLETSFAILKELLSAIVTTVSICDSKVLRSSIIPASLFIATKDRTLIILEAI